MFWKRVSVRLEKPSVEITINEKKIILTVIDKKRENRFFKFIMNSLKGERFYYSFINTLLLYLNRSKKSVYMKSFFADLFSIPFSYLK